jgi:hypothetical protein
LTPNDEVNTLSCDQFADLFGGAETYQLAESERPPGIEVSRLGGRTLFADDLDYGRLRDELEAGASVRRTRLSDTFTLEDLQAEQPAIRPAFVVKSDRLIVVTSGAADRVLGSLEAGDTLIWFPVAVTEPA